MIGRLMLQVLKELSYVWNGLAVRIQNWQSLREGYG